jgi:hypothetical protein
MTPAIKRFNNEFLPIANAISACTTVPSLASL